MSEPFPSFAQSFRVFISSILAFSSSGIVAIIYLVTKKDGVDCLSIKLAALVGFISFAITILLLVVSMYEFMKDEVQEGESSNSKEARDINKIKFRRCKYVLWSFAIGLIALVAVFLGALFG